MNEAELTEQVEGRLEQLVDELNEWCCALPGDESAMLRELAAQAVNKAVEADDRSRGLVVAEILNAARGRVKAE